MKNKKWTRREVLGSLAIMPLAVNSGISAVSSGTSSAISTEESAVFSNLQVSSKMVRCKLFNSDGDPFHVNKMERFHICDLLSRPFRIDPEFAPGEIVFMPVTTPFRISLPVHVPGFGEVFLYADNRGDGYTAGSLEKRKTLFLNYEFAADRLATIQRLLQECRDSGIKLSSETLDRVTSAESFFEQARQATGNDKAITKWTMESLRESLYAGEMIVVERARQHIESKEPRPGFMFGCNAFRFREYGSPYAKLFESLFNFATLPFYMGSIEKVQGHRDYSRVDTILKALQNTSIIKKGHPLIFLVPNATPEWAKYKSYDETKKICINYVRDSILKYRGHFSIWDVINEAHVQPDTENGAELVLGLTREQNVDLSCAAAKTAREADPTCFRIINSTGTWSDYYMGRKPSPWQQNVYDYLSMLEDAGCEYEAIGLQYYHSGRDLLEFERDVERFSHFKKPIHITELQISSSSEDIPRNNDWWGGGIGGSGFLWHGDEFTETSQADWVEYVYTILYSKPYVDAITWWDMVDPAFVPHGGFINEDLSPKESYYRLKALLEKWKMPV